MYGLDGNQLGENSTLLTISFVGFDVFSAIYLDDNGIEITQFPSNGDLTALTLSNISKASTKFAFGNRS